MPQSLAKSLVHVNIPTKGRERVLAGGTRDELHRYCAGMLQEWDSPAILVNPGEDHVHILLSPARTHAVAGIVEQVKQGSSKWLKTKGRACAGFCWQNGDGRFQSANRAWLARLIASETKPSTIARSPFKRSTALSSTDTRFRTTNGMCGIDYSAPSGRGRMRRRRTPGRCLGLDYCAPSGLIPDQGITPTLQHSNATLSPA